MQMQILSTTALTGLGTVLSSPEGARGTPQSRRFRASDPLLHFRTGKMMMPEGTATFRRAARTAVGHEVEIRYIEPRSQHEAESSENR